jgi:hypothetical protein
MSLPATMRTSSTTSPLSRVTRASYANIRFAGARFDCRKLVERDPVLGATQAADDPPVQSPTASNQPVTTPRNDLHPLPEDGMIQSVRLPRTTSRSS